MTSQIGPGTFVAIVGASGVGKDALLDHARTTFAEARGDVRFALRSITRPASAGEVHTPLSTQDFDSARRRGAFAISWHAHGLDYAIPITVDEEIGAGRVVVANVSRSVVADLRARYEHCVVVLITASTEARTERLRARGRESEVGIVARLERSNPSPDAEPDVEITNNGTIAEGTEQLARVIESALAATRAM